MNFDGSLPYALAGLVVLTAWLLARPRRSRPGNLTPKEKLLRACLGDRKLMKRLIQAEKQKDPACRTALAVSRALEALRRDNR